jgi:hypothetical protein
MTDLPTVFGEALPEDNDTPLPLLVAKRWNFPLAYHETADGVYYAIQDWVRGLTQLQDIRHVWSQLQKQQKQSQTLVSNQRLNYTASDGKVYKRDFTDDKGLYLIAQYMRVTKARPVLEEIRKFLAAAGAFVDEIRRDPDAVVLSGAMTPDQAIDAAIQMYRAQGKSDMWIRSRMEGKIKRQQFTTALSAAVSDVLNRSHYAIATDDIYKGLWGRTASYLKEELELPKKASLRDHQPMLALHYQGIAEEVCAQKLGQETELEWHQARVIVQEVAQFIGRQAQETSQLLKMDLATGRLLLNG